MAGSSTGVGQVKEHRSAITAPPAGWRSRERGSSARPEVPIEGWRDEAQKGCKKGPNDE